MIVVCADKTEDVRSGGSRAWRNDNPGNIEASDFATDEGAIGAAGGKGNKRFAVFASEADGTSALGDLLDAKADKGMTLNQAIADWAPKKENNTAAYQRAVQKATGMKGDARLSKMPPAQRKALMAAIRQHEGWQAGTVTSRPATQQ